MKDSRVGSAQYVLWGALLPHVGLLSESRRSFRPLVEQYCTDADAGWLIYPLGETDEWLLLRHQEAHAPEQGWKLHVAANPGSAETMLHRVLPILLAENTTFKVAGSMELLEALAQADMGVSQIGKFITVYPNDEDQAVRLAAELDRATSDLTGPMIPSDRPLHADSNVHYRYGVFGDRHMQTLLGEILPALRRPDGTFQPDRRLPTFQPPDWTADPFLTAGVATPLLPPRQIVADRYLLVTALHRSPRSLVFLAIDLQDGYRCVLKRARRATMPGGDGRDAADRLRHEANVLEHLANLGPFPRAFSLFEEDEYVYLVLEDIEGATLMEHLDGRRTGGELPGRNEVRQWGLELAAALEVMHRAGFVYRDLKPLNVLVNPQGRLMLIDFELACELGADDLRDRAGTRGYLSPQQAVGDPPTVADDVYSFGAVLYSLATGAEASMAPKPFSLLDRPLRLLNPDIDRQLEQVVRRCLDPQPMRRYSSMAAVTAALSAAGTLSPPTLTAISNHEERRIKYRAWARQIADTLCALAVPTPGRASLAWASTHKAGAGLRSRDINTGRAGALLALTEAAGEFALSEHLATVQQGARSLLEAPTVDGGPLPGLYVGEAGGGAALLRAGQVLSDQWLIAAAEERGDLVAAMPYRSPDLFNGTAGRLRFHLFLWDETKQRQHLDHAVAAGEELLQSAEQATDGGLFWRIPPGYDDLSGSAPLGYAHGAAGIADALLDLYDVTDARRFLESAEKTGMWLQHQAVPSLADRSGFDWPAMAGEPISARFWCHGSTGIGRFFLHLAQATGSSWAMETAEQAARSVAWGARWAGPVQCHGLAGNIEFLLDMYQALRGNKYLDEALVLGRLLDAFALRVDNLLYFPSEEPSIFSPDYMVGYAGIGVCLLRLGEPERRPHQLSRAGFLYRPE